MFVAFVTKNGPAEQSHAGTRHTHQGKLEAGGRVRVPPLAAGEGRGVRVAQQLGQQVLGQRLLVRRGGAVPGQP